MTRVQFENCWKQMTKSLRAVVINIVEAHMVTGMSISKVVEVNLAHYSDEKDFMRSMRGFANLYKRYRL